MALFLPRDAAASADFAVPLNPSVDSRGYQSREDHSQESHSAIAFPEQESWTDSFEEQAAVVVPDSIVLQGRLADPEPMTWVFAGDSDFCTTVGSSATFPRSVADRTKTEFGRNAEIFVDATHAGARLLHVRQRIQLRLSRIEPDVVTVVCGFADCRKGVEKCEEFEQSLISIVKDIQRVGAVPVLCTPLHSELSTEDPVQIDQLIYIEAIRGCVAEHSGVLIDFWEHFGSLGFPERFWDQENSRPTHAGIMEMQQFYLRQLGFSLPAKIEESSSVSPLKTITF